MRLFIRNLLWICAFAVISAGFTACSNDETGPGKTPVLSVESATATSWGSAEFTVLTGNIDEYAWIVLPSDEATPSEAVIFMDGTVVTAPATTSVIKATGNMVALTDYKIHVAAKVATHGAQLEDAFYGEVITVPFTTLDYTDDVTIIRTTKEGAEIAIKYPEIAAENVIKWGVCNMAIHAMQQQPDYAFLNLNDDAYPAAIIRGDTVLNIYNDNRWVRDANGEIFYDEWGEAAYYWEFIAPGEPLYLIMSEASWGESDWGWGEGYYSFPFDAWGYDDAYWAYYMGMTNELPDAEQFWNEGAWHKRIPFTTTMPELYEGKVSITATDLTTKGGAVVFTPDQNNMPTLYTMAIMSDTGNINNGTLGYQDIVKTYLGGDESLMQWFVSSYVAMYIIGTQTISGEEAQEPLVFSLEDFFLADYLTPGATYHAMAVAMDGEAIYDEEWDEYYVEADPMKQSYSHITFQLPDYKNPAPTIEVTAVEPTSAWKAEVNIKCTSYATNPVVEACYAANSPSEWDMYLYYGYTNYELISQNREYAVFSEDELQAINSEEGLTISFETREQEVVRVGVIGWNAEGRPSNPDENGVAETTSGSETAATPIASPYYTSLVGEWTATAKVDVAQYNYETWEMEWMPGGECTTTITIGDCYVPESLTEEVYAIYEEAGLSREAADDYFAQFKVEAQKYSDKVRGQNRILCTGWGFDKHSGDLMEYSDLRTMTPWSLFTDPSYNAATTADLFYDFGPKWFLQVAEDGSLFIPVNINRVPVASAWGQTNYLAAADYKSGYSLYMPFFEEEMNDITKWPNIPVEVSEDGNTITIKSIKYEDTTLYPNLIYDYYGQGMAFYNTAIVSEVVLTRNTTSTVSNQKQVSVAALKQHAAKANQNATMVKSANGAKYEKPNKPVMKSQTAIKAQPKAKKMEVKPLTAEQREANIKMLREKMQQRMRK